MTSINGNVDTDIILKLHVDRQHTQINIDHILRHAKIMLVYRTFPVTHNQISYITSEIS